MDGLRVGAYARVSTLNQVMEHDSSVDTQLEQIRRRAEYESDRAKTAKTPPWVIVEQYREEGKSGKNTDRPQLQRLLADVRAGKLDIVCVTKLDRITRSIIDFHGLLTAFEEGKVQFISLGDNMETSSSTGRAMLNMILVFAQLERERTSERTKEKVEMRRTAGKWFGGQVPLGYKPHKTDKTTLLIDEPDGARIARLIFAKYLEVGTVRGLVRALAQQGIKRPTRTTKNGKKSGGGAFINSSLTVMLGNLSYVARREISDGNEIDCNWPALIDRKTFDRVQLLLAKNNEKRPTGRKSAGHFYLLEGLLRCQCGGMMTATSGNGRGGKYFYYKCTRKSKTAHQSCRVRDVPANAVEGFVLDQLRGYALNAATIREAVADANAGRDQRLQKLEAELRDVRAEKQQRGKTIARLLDALEGGDGELETIRGRLRAHEAADQELKAKIAELENQRDAVRRETLSADTVAESYGRLPTLIDSAKKAGALEELRAMLRGVVDVVEWREKANPKEGGEALIQMFPLPGFWAEGVNQDGVGFAGLSKMAPTAGLEPATR